MFRPALTISICLAITILSTRATATELLPGQTLDFSTVDGTALTDSSADPRIDGTFQTPAIDPSGAAVNIYGTLISSWANVGGSNGATALFYTFFHALPVDGFPVYALPPDDASISLSGFGNQSINVAKNASLFAHTTELQSISRSVDGHTIMLSGFHNFDNASLGDRVTPQIVLTFDNSPTLLTSSAVLDLQNGGTLSADAFVAASGGNSVPEPTSLFLLPLALTALALRHRS